jgi:hypothetical protein
VCLTISHFHPSLTLAIVGSILREFYKSNSQILDQTESDYT